MHIALAFFTAGLTVLHPVFFQSYHPFQVAAQSLEASPLAISTLEMSGLRASVESVFTGFNIEVEDEDTAASLQQAQQQLQQGQYEQGLARYQELLESAEEDDPDKQKSYHIAFAYFKLAQVAGQLEIFSLADHALENAAESLKAITENIQVFDHQNSADEVNCDWHELSFRCTGDFVIRRANISIADLSRDIPYFNLLQQVYVLKGKLASRQGDVDDAQNAYYEALLTAESARTLGLDGDIAVNLIGERSTFSQRVQSDEAFRTRMLTFAKAFSIRATKDNIRTVAQMEGATLVSYSILSEKGNVFAEEQERLCASPSFEETPYCRIPRSPDQLLIFVVRPNGQISLVEEDISTQMMAPADLPGQGVCEQDVNEDVNSDACRGQTSVAIAQLIRLTRTAIGAGSPSGASSSPLLRGNAPAENFQNLSVNHAPISQQHDQLRRLYELLIEPIKEQLPTAENSHIIFIPQGSLAFVPFAALIDANGKYLVENYTIQTTPNFRTLFLANANRSQRPSTGKSAVVVGNPTIPPALKELPQIPYAEEEAQTITRYLNQKSYTTHLLTDNQATELQVRRDMQTAGIIHLATHGLLDLESELNPDVFSRPPIGALILSSSGYKFSAYIAQRDSATMALATDGILTASEIFDMHLNADLVVLSACDTAGGWLTPGGVIGLPFAFSVAGANSIVESLWSVSDNSTAQLMTRFYEYYLADPTDKARALRQAMLYMINNGHRDKVLDWAAFTLVGTSK